MVQAGPLCFTIIPLVTYSWKNDDFDIDWFYINFRLKHLHEVFSKKTNSPHMEVLQREFLDCETVMVMGMRIGLA